MMKLVLDTNVVLDIFWFQEKSLTPMREKILMGDFILYTQKDCVFELLDVLKRPIFTGSEEKAQSAWEDWKRYFTTFEGPLNKIEFCKDSDDDKFFNLAIQTQSAFILTKDKLCLKAKRKMKPYFIEVLHPLMFQEQELIS